MTALALSAWAGFDTLIDGARNDTLIGRFNADTFVLAPRDGHDAMVGFYTISRLERLDPRDLGLSLRLLDLDDAAAGAAVQLGTKVVLTTGSGSNATLRRTELSKLDADDFLFRRCCAKPRIPCNAVIIICF